MNPTDLQKLQSDYAKVRTALVGLVGVDGKKLLVEMETAIRVLPAPAADKAATLDAIHALRDTLPSEGAQQ